MAKDMKLTIYNDENPHDVLEQLRFILMEFGVVVKEDEKDKESVTYAFFHAVPLDDQNGQKEE